ncbi:MAG: ribosome-associated translation inhibitor RaiA [Candidatus Zambryskibacteria bacterium]|nr:ribosome-associated translation inhibitor RaiA [Candidatus Zambryskibacteria bacterium]
MNIRIQGPHLPLTEAIEEYVLKRITPLERLVADPSVVCEIELAKTTNHHKSGDIFKAEINMVLPDKHIYLVSEKEDLYSAIDDVREQLDHALSMRKEKKQTLFRRGASRIKDIIKNLRKS